MSLPRPRLPSQLWQAAGAPTAPAPAARSMWWRRSTRSQFVAEQVGGDRVRVTTLTAPGVEPHDLELDPEAGRQPRQRDPGAVREGPAARGRRSGRAERRRSRLSTSAAAAELIAPADTDRRASATRTSGSTRPGSPTSRTPSPRSSASGTRTAPPGTGNAPPALRKELTTLDSEFTHRAAELRGCRTFVTSHEAFGYLAKRYGLGMVGDRGADPGRRTEPGPDQAGAATSSGARR